MKIIVHRAGYTHIQKNGRYVPGENTLENASHSLSSEYIDGIEIDIQYSKEAIPFVMHENIQNMKSQEVKERYSDKNTLSEWIDFIKNNKEYINKVYYLDIKNNPLLRDTKEIYRLLDIINPISNSVYIGSCDWEFLKLLSSIKEENSLKIKIFAMFPEPIFPRMGIKKVKEYFLDNDIDGVHFFFIDSFWKELLSFFFKRGDFITVTDFVKGEGGDGNRYRVPIPNLFLFQDYYYFKSKRFIKFAKENGYLVIGASTGSINSLRKMKAMGCDILMINVPEDARLIA